MNGVLNYVETNMKAFSARQPKQKHLKVKYITCINKLMTHNLKKYTIALTLQTSSYNVFQVMNPTGDNIESRRNKSSLYKTNQD